MTTNEMLQKEVELYKNLIDKNDKYVQEFKTEVVQLTQKYLDGFNNILECQSDARNTIQAMQEEMNKMKENILTHKLYIESLKENKLIDFISTTNSKVKIFTTAIYIVSVSLLGLIATVIANILSK